MDSFTEEYIIDLVNRFSNRTLPKSEWTHQAHILVGCWHVFHHQRDTSIDLMRAKIKAFNETVGTPNTDDTGYHETLTIFWISVIDRFIKNSRINDLTDLCNAFLESKLSTREYPFRFYTRETLFSTQARLHWVDGDIQEVNRET
jgi:hypothetical protein